MNLLLAQSESDAVGTAVEEMLQNAPTTFPEAVDLVTNKLGDLWTGILLSLPIVLIGLIVFLIALVVALLMSRAFHRGIEKAGVERVVGNLLARIVKTILIGVALLFALSVMGVSVANVVTFLAVLGFAVGLAIQGILENFVAGVILLIRKPFRAGDQIVTGDFEGTVEDIDFRVTRLLGYDGTVSLVPNGDVYGNPIINLTTLGKRRTSVTVGVDYRDDHHEAKRVITEALQQVEGVLADPPAEALLTELADSSVNFELRYWTAPDIRSVRHAQDAVLASVKSAIEEAGMTIPWPIRTLVVDGDSDIRLSDRSI